MGVPPVNSSNITQHFGANLTQYNSGAGHSGRDYGVPSGTPVVATENGTVLMAGGSAYFPGAADAYATHEDYVSRLYFLKGGGGNVVAINHGGYTSTVSHLQTILVQVGQYVRKGEVIALSGYTGYTVPAGPGGAHVHFEILAHPYNWFNGGYYGRVDPAPYITEAYFQISTTTQGTHVSKSYHHETKYTTPWVQPRSFWGYPTKPTGIAIHHWGNDGQRKEDVSWFLSDPSRNPATATSAHTVLEDGWIATLAVPEVGTFHSGSAFGNGALIGIECKPEMDKGTVDTLVQYIYELEKVYGSMDIYYHQELSATACPGRYVAIRNDIINRVNTMHKNGGVDPKLAKKTVIPKPKPKLEEKNVRTALDNSICTDPVSGKKDTLYNHWNWRIPRLMKGIDQNTADIKALQAEIDKLKNKES